MDKDNSKAAAEQGLFAGEAWFDPIEAGLRGRVRGFIEELAEQELEAALGRGRYERAGGAVGHRHGHRTRRLTGSFGPVEMGGPRARLVAEDGGTEEWRSAVLPRYARRTRQLEALMAGAYFDKVTFPAGCMNGRSRAVGGSRLWFPLTPKFRIESMGLHESGVGRGAN